MKNFKSQFLLIFLLILTFDVISYGFYKFNLLEISHKPKFYLLDNQVPNDEWWTEENIWGAWHIKNGKTHQKRSCYDATYISNEVGARDSSFLLNNSNDIILIGDSFAEGYGVNLNNTSQKYIEDLTGLNVLNFGVSNNFGVVQYYSIYKKYKKNGDNNYEIFIPTDAIKNHKSKTKKIKKILKDYFWTSGLFINLNYNYKIYRAKKKYGKDTFSGYFDSNLDQQKAAIYFIKKIIKEANIDTYLVSIPRLQDFDKLNKGENLNDVYWIKSLNDISKNNKNFTFIDLIKYPISNLNDLYLKCDGHWSPEGNKWAADIISKYLK